MLKKTPVYIESVIAINKSERIPFPASVQGTGDWLIVWEQSGVIWSCISCKGGWEKPVRIFVDINPALSKIHLITNKKKCMIVWQHADFSIRCCLSKDCGRSWDQSRVIHRRQRTDPTIDNLKQVISNGNKILVAWEVLLSDRPQHSSNEIFGAQSNDFGANWKQIRSELPAKLIFRSGEELIGLTRGAACVSPTTHFRWKKAELFDWFSSGQQSLELVNNENLLFAKITNDEKLIIRAIDSSNKITNRALDLMDVSGEALQLLGDLHDTLLILALETDQRMLEVWESSSEGLKTLTYQDLTACTVKTNGRDYLIIGWRHKSIGWELVAIHNM